MGQEFTDPVQTTFTHYHYEHIAPAAGNSPEQAYAIYTRQPARVTRQQVEQAGRHQQNARPYRKKSGIKIRNCIASFQTIPGAGRNRRRRPAPVLSGPLRQDV
jgi:hypothetical protein